MDKKRYIWQDDAVYKLLETPKEVGEERRKISFKRGYELGVLSYRWFPENPPLIARNQVEKFRLHYEEYCRGFKEGYKDEQKRLSGHGQDETFRSSKEGGEKFL